MKTLLETIQRKLKTIKERRRLSKQYGIVKLKAHAYKVIDTTVNIELFK